MFYLLWLNECANKGEDGVSSHGHVGEVSHHRCKPVASIDVEHVPVLRISFAALHQHLQIWPEEIYDDFPNTFFIACNKMIPGHSDCSNVQPGHNWPLDTAQNSHWIKDRIIYMAIAREIG